MQSPKLVTAELKGILGEWEKKVLWQEYKLAVLSQETEEEPKSLKKVWFTVFGPRQNIKRARKELTFISKMRGATSDWQIQKAEFEKFMKSDVS